MEHYKLLNIPNENNKLNCEAFIHIQFAPVHPVYERDMGRTYGIEVNGEIKLFILICLIRRPFSSICSLYTLPASGLDSHEWCSKFKEQYPKTTEETEMAIYMYQRKKINNPQSA